MSSQAYVRKELNAVMGACTGGLCLRKIKNPVYTGRSAGVAWAALHAQSLRVTAPCPSRWYIVSQQREDFESPNSGATGKEPRYLGALKIVPLLTHNIPPEAKPSA